LEELLVLADLVKGDPKLNLKLAPGSHVIREVDVRIQNEALKKTGAALKGRPLDRKIVESLVEESRKLAGKGESATIIISRGVPLGGVQIAVRPLSAAMEESYAGRYDADSGARQAMLIAYLMAQIEDSPIHGNAQWQVPLSAPRTEAPPGKGDKSKDDDLLPSTLASASMSEMFKQQQEEFWKAVDTLFEPSVNACVPYTCSIMAITPKPAKE